MNISLNTCFQFREKFTRPVAQFYKSSASFYLYFDSREEITVCLPESVLVTIFSDSAASSLSSEANVLDRIVKIVLGDEVFFHVHLHEGIATDDFWWCDSTEDSGPAIFATAEESSVVL